MDDEPRQHVLEAGEEIRYVPRPRLTEVCLPGSGDYSVFDEQTVLFLHYAGDGTNASFEVTDDPHVAHACAAAFEDVWKLTTPFVEHRPQ